VGFSPTSYFSYASKDGIEYIYLQESNHWLVELNSMCLNR